MDFRYTPEEQRFRIELRKFIQDELPPEIKNSKNMEGMDEHIPLEMAFIRKMAEKGWLGGVFPKEYGGRGEGHVPMLEYIMMDELRAGAPTVGLTIAYLVGVIGNTLLSVGSHELKKRFLPRMLNAEIRFCICYSEPDAGNDIANFKTRALLDGDDYVVNGSKRFITKADTSDYMWALVRTEPGAGKHKGASILIIPTKTPGITINPIRMGHGVTTCEVYFDDVRVPKENLVGEPGKGWKYLMEALTRERATMINFRNAADPFDKFVHNLRTAEVGGKKLAQDPLIRQRTARMHLDISAGRMMQLIAGSRSMNKDYICTMEGAANKMWRAYMSWPKADYAVDTLGLYGLLNDGSPDAQLDGYWAVEYSWAGHEMSGAGGLDLNRQIIAQVGLGLPKPKYAPMGPAK